MSRVILPAANTATPLVHVDDRCEFYVRLLIVYASLRYFSLIEIFITHFHKIASKENGQSYCQCYSVDKKNKLPNIKIGLHVAYITNYKYLVQSYISNDTILCVLLFALCIYFLPWRCSPTTDTLVTVAFDSAYW